MGYSDETKGQKNYLCGYESEELSSIYAKNSVPGAVSLGPVPPGQSEGFLRVVNQKERNRP